MAALAASKSAADTSVLLDPQEIKIQAQIKGIKIFMIEFIE